MDQYCAAAGGEDYVWAWSDHYDIYQYNCDERDEYVRSGFTKRSPYCDFIEQKYAYVGWPTPWEIYPTDGPWEGHDIDWSTIFGNRIKSYGPPKPDTD
ncbi:MAG: hypothetical protein WD075_04190 [Rhodospirillales bacterium]